MLWYLLDILRPDVLQLHIYVRTCLCTLEAAEPYCEQAHRGRSRSRGDESNRSRFINRTVLSQIEAERKGNCRRIEGRSGRECRARPRSGDDQRLTPISGPYDCEIPVMTAGVIDRAAREHGQ